MKMKLQRRIGLLLTAVFCIVFLTGCPPRVDQEKREETLSAGHEKLSQAMKEYYGLEEEAYQIVSEEIKWGSAHGFEAVAYRLEIGDATVRAIVFLDSGELFTDYYGKEFEEILVPYLNEKVNDFAELQKMQLELLSVSFAPARYGLGMDFDGTIPANVSPERFEMFLEECGQTKSISISLTAAWYSKEAEEIPEDLFPILKESMNNLPIQLLVKHIVCEDREKRKPSDLKEEYNYNEDGRAFRTDYAYLEAADNLIIRKNLGTTEIVDHTEAGKNAGTVEAEFGLHYDTDGNLTIYPGDDWYDLFFKDGKEGTEVRVAGTDDEKAKKNAASRPHSYWLYQTMKADPCFERWCYVEWVRGYCIELDEEYSEAKRKKSLITVTYQ